MIKTVRLSLFPKYKMTMTQSLGVPPLDSSATGSLSFLQHAIGSRTTNPFGTFVFAILGASRDPGGLIRRSVQFFEMYERYRKGFASNAGWAGQPVLKQ